MQEITGPNAFKELELESNKYKISTMRNRQFLLVDERNPTARSIVVDAAEIDP